MADSSIVSSGQRIRFKYYRSFIRTHADLGTVEIYELQMTNYLDSRITQKMHKLTADQLTVTDRQEMPGKTTY